ncbi:MAG: hypothetical protein DRO13_05655, partial [Thermoprotei archaeon]
IYARLADLRLVLEKISMGLEYALSVKNFQEIAREVSKLLKDLKKLPETTIPEIGLILVNLEHSIRNIEEATVGVADSHDFFVASDSEVNRIMSEAREILRKKLETELSVNDVSS